MKINLLEAALSSDRIVLSVIGPHAGESMSTIFSRKMKDIRVVGKTFWLYGSHVTKPQFVQAHKPGYVLFLAPSANNGARPTTVTQSTSEFSIDKQTWQPLPEGLSPVTGRAGYALTLSMLESCPASNNLDLWDYASGMGAVRFRLGTSTVLVEKKDSSTAMDRMVSRFRRVVAVGRLVEPFSVWVR